MSKCIIKTNFHNALNLISLQTDENFINEDEVIIEVKYEISEQNKSIYHILALLSKGTIIFIEYNTVIRKTIKMTKNLVLCSLINIIEMCDFSFFAPIVVASSSNEILYIDTKDKNKDMVNLNEENIIVLPTFVENQILDLKFNYNKSYILICTNTEIQTYKISFDKEKQKNCLIKHMDIMVVPNISDLTLSEYIGSKIYSKFADYNENIIYFMYMSQNDQDQKQIINLNDHENNGHVYFHFTKTIINKKDTSTKILKTFQVGKNIIKIAFSYFYEKLLFLFENKIICCLNPVQSKEEIFDKFQFTNHQNTNIKFNDIFIHSSSNFIVVQDTEYTYFIFDFTLNLYYVINNSKIINRINYPFFTKQHHIRQTSFKSYDIYSYMKSIWKSAENLSTLDDLTVDRKYQDVINIKKNRNHALCLYDSKYINLFFLEIISKLSNDSLPNSFDEIHLFKSHLKGQNYESAFKVLKVIDAFNIWIQCFIMILNKLCGCPSNIILIKKSAFEKILVNIMSKKFNDDTKNNAIQNIKILCFSNLFYRCLSTKQYEYAYLIAEKLNLQYLYKIINSHCKLNKCLGVAYLACTKLEEKQENEDSIISDLNKIIQITNFTLSQNNLQIILKDLDHVLDNINLNNEYIRENNNLEINLQKYMEGLKNEMEGKFDDAKQIYKENNMNYDFMRIEKIQKEIKNQTNEESIFEFNDI